jgi:hypothetical protein
MSDLALPSPFDIYFQAALTSLPTLLTLIPSCTFRSSSRRHAMVSTSSTRGWIHVGLPVEPNSWVFFVVAQIAGRHRPVAIVSSVGADIDATLQGYPLTAACHRTITIFTDRANHRAVRAELALAAGYYMRGGDDEYRPELVELPDIDSHKQPCGDLRLWDCASVRPFPFIAACLLQGVGFHAHEGFTNLAYPESLGVVYRDTSAEWGMVVVDITNLEAVRYGIVGFSSCEMLIDNAETQRGMLWSAGHGALVRGKHRVMEGVRPRRAMSAAEYLTKLRSHRGSENFTSHSDSASELLAGTPLIEAAAMDLVWPPEGTEDDIIPSLASLSVGANDRSLPAQAVRSLIHSTLDIEDFDMFTFDQVRAIPGFQDLLRRYLEQHWARLGSSRSVGQLIGLAFAGQEHLGLEQLKSISVEAISAALVEPKIGKATVTSISLCIDSIQGTPTQLVDVLSRADTLRELYFLQSPTRESDTLSALLFEELAARPQILRRAKVMFAGAYSAALRGRFWLPTIPKGPDTVQIAPLDVFPVQQILVRTNMSYGGDEFLYKYIYLGDALLKPERFAAGLLLYLHSLVMYKDAPHQMQLFSFSSAPASIASDALTSAEVSPILAENFAVSSRPRVRDLVPGGWTVIVSQEEYKAPRYRSYAAHFIRYAFVRASQRRISVDLSPRTPPGPEELEVVGLKEFLGATAPEVDTAIVDRRLHNLAEKLAAGEYEGTLPPGTERLSALSQAEAANMLPGFFEGLGRRSEY